MLPTDELKYFENFFPYNLKNLVAENISVIQFALTIMAINIVQLLP